MWELKNKYNNSHNKVPDLIIITKNLFTAVRAPWITLNNMQLVQGAFGNDKWREFRWVITKNPTEFINSNFNPTMVMKNRRKRIRGFPKSRISENVVSSGILESFFSQAGKSSQKMQPWIQRLIIDTVTVQALKFEKQPFFKKMTINILLRVLGRASKFQRTTKFAYEWGTVVGYMWGREKLPN